MKFLTVGISVSLWATAMAFSQSVGTSLPGIHTSPIYEKRVVSVHSLQHSLVKKAQKLELQAMREYSKKHFEQALKLLKNASSIDPDSVAILNNLGAAYCALGKDKEAEDLFQKAVQLDPAGTISFGNLASVAFNNFQYELAEASARQAVRLTPDYVPARIMLGLSQLAQGHWTTEAHKLIQENRTRFAEAEQILRAWPEHSDGSSESGRHVSIRGAGPGALMQVSERYDNEAQ